MQVIGVPFEDGEFAGRWVHVDLVLDDKANEASEHEVQGMMVDAGLLVFSSSEALTKHGATPGQHEQLIEALEANEQDAAPLPHQGPQSLACNNRWGDGMFTMSRVCDTAGNTIRIRAKLGTPQVQHRMRQLRTRAMGAIVTNIVLEKTAPVRFAERMEPNSAGDTGWFLATGREDDAYMNDASNFSIVAVSTAISLCEPFAKIILAPEGSQFTLIDGEFVED